MTDVAQHPGSAPPAPLKEDAAVLLREAFADLMTAPQPARPPERRSFALSEDEAESA